MQRGCGNVELFTVLMTRLDGKKVQIPGKSPLKHPLITLVNFVKGAKPILTYLGEKRR